MDCFATADKTRVEVSCGTSVGVGRYDILTAAAQSSRSAALDGSLLLFPTRKIKLN